MDDEKIPAWLLCEEMLNKAKTEFITQAMDIIRAAVAAKDIEINGSLITQPDRPSDTEMDLFIINRLLEEKEKMTENYSNYMAEKESKPEELTPQMIERMEKLKKFLLSIEKISMLMEYAKAIEQWITYAGMNVTINDQSEIIAKSCKDNPLRIKILDYMLKNETMMKEEVFTESERGILQLAKDILSK